MTAKPSPVSLTPGQRPRSPTPGIYTAAAPRWDAGQGAWLGYLGGDPPPTPKKRTNRLSTRSRPPAPRPSASRSLSPCSSPSPSSFRCLAASSPWFSRQSLSLPPSFSSPSFLLSSSLFCSLSLSLSSFSLYINSLLCVSCPSVSLPSPPLLFLSPPFLARYPLACLSVSLFSPLSLSFLSPPCGLPALSHSE